ncbi:helix-turn-helix transcriptional regulator [Phytoactinopolyspora halotolerans]|uniref:YafY family transcriptional regulator n=1 Tax=Phytoactinopolyspora halotolerans TaxID=1981512 RepID=A0A6L9SBY3_9ACTN|nr:YafY family protein [Phytoactinopolyspora halotolerans]NEE02529.1 YafY family transcriptional regulator [Phytoactinopolyspora halotolerans]
MRADRLVEIVLLLQAHGRLTAAEMARRLEVSARTIQRDLDALSSAGVPVYADRGHAGGWSLAADYRTRLNGLTPAEAASLFVSTTEHILTDLGFGTAARSAAAKLLSTVPASARRAADFARERILVDHADWTGGRESGTWLPVLQQGLWDELLVRMVYGAADHRDAAEHGTDQDAGSGTGFVVAPLGLVAKKRAWYLVAQRDDGALRTYRVSRIRHVELTDERFQRPPGFDLAEHWTQTNEQYFAGLRDTPVRLRVRDAAGHRLRWAPNAVIDEATQRDDGWWEVAMTFEKRYEARVYLLGLAGDVVVLDPPELRADMLHAARAFVDAHDHATSSASTSSRRDSAPPLSP